MTEEPEVEVAKKLDPLAFQKGYDRMDDHSLELADRKARALNIARQRITKPKQHEDSFLHAILSLAKLAFSRRKS